MRSLCALRRPPWLTLVLAAAAMPCFDGARAQEGAAPEAGAAARLERIERLLSNQGLVRMLQQLEAMQREMERLRGEMEMQRRLLEQISKQQRDLYADLDERLRRLQAAPPRQVAAFDPAPGAAEPMLEPLYPIIEPQGAGAFPREEAALALGAGAFSREEALPAPGAGAFPQEEAASAPGAFPREEAAPAPGMGAFPQDEAVSPAGVGAFPREAAWPAPGAGQTPPLVESDPEQARAEYRRAFDLLRRSRYEQAVPALRAFLARHAGAEQAPDARFWLGESYYANKRFDLALDEYSRLLRDYPDSRKAAQAQLKVGFCLYELGRVEQAARRLEEVARQYPGTTVARLAEERLREFRAVTLPHMAPVN